MSPHVNRRYHFVFGLSGLILLTLLLYGAVIHFQFVNYDDDVILLKNKVVQNSDLRSIFTTESANDYVPLTLATFALEYHFVKLNPLLYHLDNLILHILNTLLVVWLLFELTNGHLLFTFVVSALFVIHPLHVESVAWVTQRKDVLCTFFSLLSLIFYLKHSKGKESKTFLAASLVFFVLALLSKAMAITLPFIFILSDRLVTGRRQKLRTFFMEKMPFFILAAAVVILHLSTHDTPTLMKAPDRTWLNLLSNAFEALAFYISKSLIPVHLSAFYKQGFVQTAPWEYVASLVIVAGAVILAFKGKLPETRKWVVFGGIFFLVSIAPVLQFIPYGNHFLYSDHYFYVPGIGLLLIYACAGRELWRARGRLRIPGRAVAALAALGIGLFFPYLTYARVQVWRNSETLWKDAIVKYPNNPIAYFNLAGYYTFDAGRPSEALAIYDKEQEITPSDPLIFFNRGMALNKLGRPRDAVEQFKKALQLAPGVKQIYFNLGVLYGILNQPGDAVAILTEYEKMHPEDPQVHVQLYKAYLGQGRSEAALREYELSERLKNSSKQ